MGICFACPRLVLLADLGLESPNWNSLLSTRVKELPVTLEHKGAGTSLFVISDVASIWDQSRRADAEASWDADEEHHPTEVTKRK